MVIIPIVLIANWLLSLWLYSGQLQMPHIDNLLPVSELWYPVAQSKTVVQASVVSSRVYRTLQSLLPGFTQSFKDRSHNEISL